MFRKLVSTRNDSTLTVLRLVLGVDGLRPHPRSRDRRTWTCAGLCVGSLEGTNRALQQTLRGAYETTTFFLPAPRPQPTASEPGTLLEVRF